MLLSPFSLLEVSLSQHLEHFLGSWLLLTFSFLENWLLLTFSNFGSFCSFLRLFTNFLRWRAISLMAKVLPVPEVSRTLCICPRGFGHSIPRGITLESISFLGPFSTILLILMIEHLWICYCRSRSLTSLIRHERYAPHFHVFRNVLCIFYAFHAFAMFICSF